VKSQVKSQGRSSLRLRLLVSAAGERLGAVIVTAAYLGMRRGELLGLRWRDVDLDGATLDAAEFEQALAAIARGRDEAILRANRVRLRPILMTTVMLVLGMIPIALGQGPGAGSRGSIARVIVGGQLLSLLITLLITPVAYSLFDDLGNMRVFARLRSRVTGLRRPAEQATPRSAA
jgi:hypothetical protein